MARTSSHLSLARMCGQAVLIESGGRLVFANREAAELLGMDSSGALIGRSLRELVPSFGATPVAEDAEARAPAFRCHVLTRPDGTQMDVEIAADACTYQKSDAVQMVLRGGENGCDCPDSHPQGAKREIRRSETTQRLARLTPREREVLDLLVAGKSGNAIALLLGMSLASLGAYRTQVMEKLQARSVAALVAVVVETRG